MATTLLNARQVTDLLGVDASTVYRMAADGRLPAVKVGKQWRFPESAIRELTSPPRSDIDHPAIDPEAARAVIDLVASPLGVMMVVTDPEGVPLTPIVNPCEWMAVRAEDPVVVEACVADWHALASDLDLTPRFKEGPLGFECARAFIRAGSLLVGMVLAGGIAPAASCSRGLYYLDEPDRHVVLENLPKVAALLSRVAVTKARSNS